MTDLQQDVVSGVDRVAEEGDDDGMLHMPKAKEEAWGWM